MKFMNITFVLIYLFLISFIPTKAFASCEESKSASIAFGQCGAKVSKLQNLFMRKENYIQNTDGLPHIYKEQIQVPYPIKRPAHIKKTLTSVIVPPRVSEPIYKDNYLEIVSNSTNKSLSKFGPDAPAQFIIRCQNSKLNILLNFPGYPMKTKQHLNAITYQIDQGNYETALFEPANEFSSIGIWENRSAYTFLSSILKGKVLKINTEDLEDTQINADFSIDDISAKFDQINVSCNLPSYG